MSAIIYPIEFLRRQDTRWLAQVARATVQRRSKSEGTDSCRCGHEVVAPRSSSCTATAMINEWHCSACDRRWKTYADGPAVRGVRS